MLGVCPVPYNSITFNDGTSSTIPDSTVTTPGATFDVCAGGGSSTVITGTPSSGTTVISSTTPVPGPPGPPGPAGAAGTLTILQNGVSIVSTAAAVNFTGTGVAVTTADGITADVDISGGSTLTIKMDGTDVVSNTTAINFIEGTVTVDDTIATQANITKDSTMEDLSDWFSSTKDWLKNIKNWGLKDWLKLLYKGAGLYLAGVALKNMFDKHPSGDGNASSSYNGSDASNDTGGTGGGSGSTGSYSQTSVADLIAGVMEAAGFDPAQYTIDAALDSIDVDMVIANNPTGQTVIDMVLKTFFVDVTDSGGIIKFFPQSFTPIVVFTERDLGFVTESSSPEAPVSGSRSQGIDLPKTVRVSYTSKANALNTGSQETTLFSQTSGSVQNLSIPFALDDDAAKALSERILIESHQNRQVFAFTTSYGHKFVNDGMICGELEPGDVVGLDTAEFVGNVRVQQITDNGDGTITWTGVESIEFAASSIAAAPLPVYSKIPATTYTGYSAGLIFEGPQLISDNLFSNTRLLLAPHGYGADNFKGCVIYVSTDGGNTYDQFASVANSATFGIVEDALPPCVEPFLWDDATTFSVDVKGGTLTNASKVDVLNGSNWAYVGRELIGFTTAALTASVPTTINGITQTVRTYTISGLRRGLKGTDVYTDTHEDDEPFILNNSNIIPYPYAIADKNKTFKFKFVTIGSDLSLAEEFDGQPDTSSIRPWRVADFEGVKTGNDWNFTWVARNQFEPEMVDLTSTIKPEQFAGFIFQILESDLTTVVNTITQQDTAYTYTEAQQITDFGSAQTTIYARVSQLDLRVGPGPDVTKTFT